MIFLFPVQMSFLRVLSMLGERDLKRLTTSLIPEIPWRLKHPPSCEELLLSWWRAQRLRLLPRVWQDGVWLMDETQMWDSVEVFHFLLLGLRPVWFVSCSDSTWSRVCYMWRVNQKYLDVLQWQSAVHLEALWSLWSSSCSLLMVIYILKSLVLGFIVIKW